MASSTGGESYTTLLEYVGKGGADVGDDLVVLLCHLQYACKRIAALVASPFNAELGRDGGGGVPSSSSSSKRDAPKPLDIVSVPPTPPPFLSIRFGFQDSIFIGKVLKKLDLSIS